jgi:hypothetical protein
MTSKTDHATRQATSGSDDHKKQDCYFSEPLFPLARTPCRSFSTSHTIDHRSTRSLCSARCVSVLIHFIRTLSGSVNVCSPQSYSIELLAYILLSKQIYQHAPQVSVSTQTYRYSLQSASSAQHAHSYERNVHVQQEEQELQAQVQTEEPIQIVDNDVRYERWNGSEQG